MCRAPGCCSPALGRRPARHMRGNTRARGSRAAILAAQQCGGPCPGRRLQAAISAPLTALIERIGMLQEDMALIISNTKRRPRIVKEKSPSGGYGSG